MPTWGRKQKAGTPAAGSIVASVATTEATKTLADMTANAEAARDLRYLKLWNVDWPGDATALLEGFSLVPGGWPNLQELDNRRVGLHLFLPQQVEMRAPIYPALQSLSLVSIPGPIDGVTLFSGLAQLPSLRRLKLWHILFKKWDSLFNTSWIHFRLIDYTYVQDSSTGDDPEATASGWHIPISSGSPKELFLLLKNRRDLSPVLDNPSCLAAIETLYLSHTNGCLDRNALPLDAYAGVLGLCPRLKTLRIPGECESILTALVKLLPCVHAPLRTLVLIFLGESPPTPVEAAETLAELDCTLAGLLHLSAALRNLRVFKVVDSWEWFLSLFPFSLVLPAVRARCLRRGVIYENETPWDSP